MNDIKSDFHIEFELIKKQTHEAVIKLFEKYPNAKNWKVKFEYDWGVNAISSIDKDDTGWYDNLIAKRDVLNVEEKIE